MDPTPGEPRFTLWVSDATFDRIHSSLDDPEMIVPELVELLRAEPLPRG